ncbi:hypothetical protein K402DRAFT_387945 [Aulographum hederae CBS 113979]|uniref:GYF domain-containing protein n=1 Tax=Aulographum hederae CBS 113979 TaxID=1176131 RepID=A0A6G1HGU5_9PEZI|nr:hypothetical protein K402DRAFT_387945 [Aulographum hederae CBS 113979]
MAPSSFASAAAGKKNSASRADGSAEESKERRANGTQTFRKSSSAISTSNPTPARDSNSTLAAPTTTNAGVYVSPRVNAFRNGSLADNRYPKEQLLDLYKAQQESGELSDDLSSLYVAGWEPGETNGAQSLGWGRKDDAKDNQPSADICWNGDGNGQPLSLAEMTDEEKDLFSTSVNSPIKGATQPTAKEGTPKDGLSLRKVSISQAQNGAYGIASPTSARGPARRRETSESYPFPASSVASPAGARLARDEPSAVTPPAILRRRTEVRDSGPTPADERDKDTPDKGVAEGSAPFGGLKRTTTGPFSAGTSGPSSPWSATPTGSGFPGGFGNFAIGTGTSKASTAADKRPGYGSMRSESRFKGLMARDSDVPGAKEKASTGSLDKVQESERDQKAFWSESRANRPLSEDTDPYPDEELRTGSAALGGGMDDSPPRFRGLHGLGTPMKQEQREESFSAFGMTADTSNFRDSFQGREQYQHHTPHQRGGGEGTREPMSPTDTNPYQSPDQRTDPEDHDAEGPENHLRGISQRGGPGGGFGGDQLPGLGGFGNVGRPSAFEAAASDRSQTSSTGPNRGFPALGGLGTLSGLGGSSTWSAQPSVGTPSRERAAFGGAFGDNMFGSLGGDFQSPSLAGLGSSGSFGGGLGGTIGRQNKMSSLFPSGMQEQMRGDQERQGSEEPNFEGIDRQTGAFGAFGRGVFGSNAPGTSAPARDFESPFSQQRGFFEEQGSDPLFAGNQGIGSFALPGSSQPASGGQRSASQSISGPAPGPTSSASNQPPNAQQKTMVMPDRMRWIYRDPQGKIQGPWSGLEMHDWYKAGFFSPELLVKKYEDPDYEPLAQLIRRIGNSREPFLVPQIGIPHGLPTTQAGQSWAQPAPSSSSAQPPFASSFPSFGTTLTAEQQNALERRKQEEQYLMARQKEHLAHVQVMQKQMGPMAMHPGQLHHVSSAHSLHSQPSFGSITSPGGYQPSPTQGPVSGGQGMPGFFDNSFRLAPQSNLGPVGGGMDMLGHIREEDMPAMLERLNLNRGQQGPLGVPVPFGQQQQDPNTHAQQVAAMLNDRARLLREQVDQEIIQRMSQNQQLANQSSAERLQEFHNLRAQFEAENPLLSQVNAEAAAVQGALEEHTRSRQHSVDTGKGFTAPSEQSQVTSPDITASTLVQDTQNLSLTDQVKAASAKQSPAPNAPWAKIDTGLPQPFPAAPPKSSSPMPAPVAQRKQNLADTLNVESQSRSESPSVSVDTPSASIAPWAKETTEATKGPSLKEIQAAEAKKAAQQEKIEAAARRAALERELLAQANSQAAPGLPSTSTWGSGVSPSTPTASTPSAWAKPAVGKPALGLGPATAGKKTLQQIQKEEEARKQRAAAASTAAAGPSGTPVAAGKTYAGLASKTPVGPAAMGGGAWTTVGSSGKVRAPSASVGIPTGPAAAVRSASGNVQTLPRKTATPLATAGRTPTAGSQINAMEEFKKWAVSELKDDLSKAVNVDEFVASLLAFPAEMEIITEAVHSNSQTIDSRHFAEQFIRRRKMADKGLVDPSSPATGQGESKSGGWNEVAKKAGGQPKQDEGPGNFKVVAAKKKGGKR